jgi:hypothetical protein
VKEATPRFVIFACILVLITAEAGRWPRSVSAARAVQANPPLTIVPGPPLPDAVVGQQYSASLKTQGGYSDPHTGQASDSISIAANGDWPLGLSWIALNGGTNASGNLYGVPTKPGSYSMTVTASDTKTTISQVYALTVHPAPPPPVLSLTANTYHVFPQFADGVAADGSYYQSTAMISNPSPATANCVLQLYGLTVNGSTRFTIDGIAPGSAAVVGYISSKQALKSGYATLQCSAKVDAQLVYSLYAQSGSKLSEATVFSSPPASSVEVFVNNTEGANLGIAVANDSDQTASYTISAYGQPGSLSTSFSLSPRSNRASYVSQLIPGLPAGFQGTIIVSAQTGAASVIGLRFTGVIFTTIPEMMWSGQGVTANTYHVFPQFADGVAADGSYYKSTLMVSNTSATNGSCTFRLYGLTVNGSSVVSFPSLGSRQSVIQSISSSQQLKSGYATLQCSVKVEAQLLYSYYGAGGGKISEATVFSSPPSGAVELVVDNRSGSLGVAVSNDTDQSAAYAITALDGSGVAVGTTSLQVAARSNRATFLNQLIPSLPSDYHGAVFISAGAGSVSAIGLRYTGTVFTTFPETQLAAALLPATPAGPVIAGFSAGPSIVMSGQSATLSWAVSNATSVSISGIGSVAAVGTLKVFPAASTTYTLTATNSAAAVSATTAVAVAASDPSVLPYQIIDLGKDFFPTSVSDVPVNGGSVIVTGQLGHIGIHTGHAAMWYDGSLTDLHPLLANDPTEPNTDSIALGVGTGVVGYKTAGYYPYGFWYVNGNMDDWSQRLGYNSTTAVSVNTQGQIAATGSFADNNGAKVYGAVLWEDGALTPLPTYHGTVLSPVKLLTDLLGNHAKVLANVDGVGGVIADAVTGSIQTLPLHQVFAFNRNNQVLGGSGFTYLWNGSGNPIADSLLPVPDPLSGFIIPGIGGFGFVNLNNSGFAVGLNHLVCIGLPGQYQPSDMHVVPLDLILPFSRTGWKFGGFIGSSGPVAINDAGYIVGGGQIGGEMHGYMLIPKAPNTSLPVAPANLVGTRSAAGITLTWTDNSNDAYWFEIEAQTTAGGDFQYIGVASPNSTSFMPPSNLSATAFRIRARNLIGPSTYSGLATAP